MLAPGKAFSPFNFQNISRQLMLTTNSSLNFDIPVPYRENATIVAHLVHHSIGNIVMGNN